MPHFNNYLLDQIIVPSLVLFFFIGGVLAVVVGIGLIVNSAAVLRIFGSMNHTFSTRQATKQISVPIDSSGFVAKYRVWIGAFFVIGAVYSLYGLIAKIDNAAVVTLLNLSYPRAFVLWIVESSRIFLIVTCSISLLVGILLGFFPDTLRTIEQRSAHWYSTRRMTPEADRMNLTLDRWVSGSPRAAGWIIFFPALAVTAYFGSLLLGRG